MKQPVSDLLIIGAGAVGLGVGYQIARRYPDMNITILEKERNVSEHQTGNNSGVIHSGIYYKPGSYKAKNCIDGRIELVAFAKEHGVQHDVCGKIIVATQEEELVRLEKIYKTGLENGLTNCQIIDDKGIREFEPYCAGIKGIFVPYTGIIDYRGMCEKLKEIICQINPRNQVITAQEVKAIHRGTNDSSIRTANELFKTKHLIACAGLQSDRMARLDGMKTDSRIVPFRGDYFDLHPKAVHKVKNLIYPVPNPAFPFLGVHFTRMVMGGVECGPSAVFSFKREGYTKTDFDLADAINALTFAGTWKLFSKNWKFGLEEYKKAFSKPLFLKQLQRLIPSLTMDELVEGRSGVRAMALKPDGEMVDDFLFVRDGRSIHVLNAPSPAATACLAIGTEVRKIAEDSFNW